MLSKYLSIVFTLSLKGPITTKADDNSDFFFFNLFLEENKS